ncbi:MAG: SIR2 family protein, partial [Acidimicrobiia bacterium]
MRINQDVDLPQALLTAQRDGRLVVFAGAGVSMGPPSNLPGFEQLAHAVAGGVLTRKEGETLDAFLGRVEQQGVNVQA